MNPEDMTPEQRETYDDLGRAIERHMATTHPDDVGLYLNGFILQASAQSADTHLWSIMSVFKKDQSMVSLFVDYWHSSRTPLKAWS